MGRKEAREHAFKILYQTDIQKCDYDSVLSVYYNENTIDMKDKQYIDSIIKGIFENIESVDGYLINGVKSWTLNRISKIDKAVLRLAIYEIFYREDIPESISIYEAVELVKKFDSDEAGGFVNGILRSILRKTKEE